MEDRNDGSVAILNEKWGGLRGIASKLNVNVDSGLSGSDTEERKRVFGPNKVEMKPPKGFFLLAFEALQDPTLLLLCGCAVISLGAGIYDAAVHPGSNEWIEGISIIFTIVVVVCVAAGTDYAKEKQFRALSALASDVKVSVQRNGATTEVSIFELVVGDILWLRYGDLLAADGLLIESQQMKCDEAALTGEPVLIAKDPVEKPFVLSGTKVGNISVVMTPRSLN